MKQFIFTFLLFQSLLTSAQGYVSYDHFSTSTLRDDTGNRFGSGDMRTISAGYNIPLSMKMNEHNQPTLWSAGISGTYAIMSNSGEAKELNPCKIINSGISLTHLRPISKKWSILASVGCGIYAPVDEISFRSILGSGGIIFICRLNDHLSLGVGGGITNSYGAPMAMPMLYLNWQHYGKFSFEINMANSLKVSASTWLWKKLKLEFTPLEVDGLAAITVDSDNKEWIYSMTMLQSYFSPSYHFNDKFSIFTSIGGNWIRGISKSERSLKGFFSSFNDNDEEKPYFQAALRLSAGIRFKF